MKFLLNGVVLLVIGFSSVCAQSIEGRTLTVAGEGSVTAVSDRAYIYISFETEGPTASEALDSHEEEVRRIKAALLEAGIQDEEIRVERIGFGGQNQYGYGAAPDEEEKHVVTQRLIVTVDNLDEVEGLVSTIAQDNVSDSLEDLLDIPKRTVEVQYGISDRTSYEDEALEEAIERARARAERSASQAGVSLGRVLVLREHGVFGSLSGGLEEMAELSSMIGTYPVISGEQRITARVIMSFEIE